MMVLQHPAARSSTSVMQKAALRRKRSKGTIVAFGNEGKTTEVTELVESHSSGANTAASSSQPQHAADAPHTGPAKPCHAARLALMCAKNAQRMGARVQLFLCPPGRVRRELQTALRQRQRGSSGQRRILADAGGYYGLEKLVGQDSLVQYDIQEEDFLLRANTYDEDSDEEASSGDEDDLSAIDELFSEETAPVDDQMKYFNLREPLFVSAGSESSPGGPSMAAMGPGAPGKLPFNWRKIRYFDIITAADSAAARTYLKEELRRSRLREALALTRHLRKVQREERRKRRIEKGETVGDSAETDAADERALLSAGVEPFKEAMTPAASAALLLESLCVNPLESVEGMAKCYDGIVTAGVALLDSAAMETSSLHASESKSRVTRSEIVAALTPLLITSLEHASGEVILMLAKLRRMCATVRYQRRFVQRVAPCLIRPPQAAMWCLKHQNDMEAILAAAELIFDSAFDIFSKGWYERGRLLLADSKRVKTLDSAAAQLRNLSSEPADGLALALPGKGNRRRLMSKSTRGGDATHDVLAEWEVMAVDRQIRVSISNVLLMDWSRTVVHSDIPRPHNRRATMSHSVRRISALPQPAASTENSPRASSSMPRSPSRGLTPQSPTHAQNFASTTVQAEGVMESAPSSSSTNPSVLGYERPHSPPPSMLSPTPSLQRASSKESDSRSQTPPRSPKSPIRTTVADLARNAEQQQPPPPPTPTIAPLSPKRSRAGLTPRETLGSMTPTQGITTPLSPSSVGTTGSGEIIAYRPNISSTSASSSGTAVTAHYRMLTSSPAERKRTVAACRALRAQIQRFEDAFVQLHGRPPKGPADRAPLASTYSQYREWKRAIRADAASRIQALIRGASTRLKLLRLNDPDISSVVMRRAGRVKTTIDVINDISIPVDIGQSEERLPVMQQPAVTSSPEAFSAPTPNLAPTWASRVVRRRNGSDRDAIPTPTPPSPYVPPAATPPPPIPASAADMNYLSLAELQNRKRDLKQQLKQYDMNFARRHGRMPVKAEKEPIRHLYESYNALKSQITRMERESRQTNQLVAPGSPIAVASSLPISQRNVSPTSETDSAHSGGEESPARGSGPPPSRTRRKVPRSSSPPMTSQSSASSASASSAASSQDLAALKAEKSRLHQMLRSYEKDFFREHNRQVSSFADIRPVASQYRRYKEIKKAIAAYQQREQG